MQFHLENPPGLLSFIGVGLLAILMLRNRRRARHAFTWKRFFAVTFAMSLVAFSLARPQFGRWAATTVESRANLFIAVDISKSMLAEDVPGGRLRLVSALARQLLGLLPGMRVAVFPFAGDGYLQMPLSSDLETALDLIDALDPAMTTTQGTDLAVAMETLLESIQRLKAQTLQKEQSWSPTQVLVWSDGETHGPRIDAIAEKFRHERIPIFVVGVGTEAGGMIPVQNAFGGRGYLRDAEDRPVRTKLEPKALEALARISGGEYVPGQLGALPALARRLQRRAEIARMASQFKAERELGPTMLLAAFLILLLELFSARWEYALRVGAIAWWVFAAPAARAEDRDLDATKPAKAPFEIYNDAVGKSEQGAYKDAVELFQSVAATTTDKELRKKALYNAGNSLMQLLDPTQAQEHYQQAFDTHLSDRKLEAEANQRISENLVLAAKVKEMMKQMAQQKGDSDDNKDGKGEDPKGPKNDYEAETFDDQQKKRLYDTVSAEEQQALQRQQSKKNQKPKSGPKGKEW